MNSLYLQCKGQCQGAGGKVGKVEKLGRNECTLYRWPRSPEINNCRKSNH